MNRVKHILTLLETTNQDILIDLYQYDNFGNQFRIWTGLHSTFIKTIVPTKGLQKTSNPTGEYYVDDYATTYFIKKHFT